MCVHPDLIPWLCCLSSPGSGEVARSSVSLRVTWDGRSFVLCYLWADRTLPSFFFVSDGPPVLQAADTSAKWLRSTRGQGTEEIFFLASDCREKVRFSSGRVEQVLKGKTGRVKLWVLRGPNKVGMAMQTRATWIQEVRTWLQFPVSVSRKGCLLSCQSDPKKQTLCADSSYLSLFLSPSATCSPDAHN